MVIIHFLYYIKKHTLINITLTHLYIYIYIYINYAYFYFDLFLLNLINVFKLK